MESIIELAIWILVGFVCGSVPWAVIVGNLLVRDDVRSVGDGNPGAINAWKSGGWVPGMISMTLEIGKGFFPVYFAMQYVGQSSGAVSQAGLALVAFAPIVGHGWSPFLRFKGGKALAASWGSWIAITGGVAFPVGCLLLGLMHLFQRNHAITVTFCLVMFLAVFLPLQIQPYVFLFWAANLTVVIYKHRTEYSTRILVREWIVRLTRKLA
ncbi:uncharacterized protein METZ01_LOCUS339075 [marine metagenome]|uniref:Uncharacterized protein n=1 Tax=marine metagenome TaxID=408172 RepID=A0A382QPF6_9ZZZZ